MSSLQIGHLLRAGTTGFVAGCSVSRLELPSLGALVRAPLDQGYTVYGLITDIHIDDDGLVRQLVTVGEVPPEVRRDNRERRIVPVEMSVLAVGYRLAGRISHLLPPRPPLSLDILDLCPPEELTEFIHTGRFGYFRHLLRAREIPIGEVLAAHLEQVKHLTGDEAWLRQAAGELITQLRDDYPTLMSVLGALGEVV